MFDFLKNKKSTGASDNKDIILELQKVEGQLTDNEIRALFGLAKEVAKDQAIVEIGSYRGKSTLALAIGSSGGNSAKVYSIDPHQDFVGINGGVFGPNDLKQFYTNVNAFEVGNLIFKICLDSKLIGKIWNQPVGLLWIDGDHSYEAVTSDVNSFKHSLSKNAIVAFHDYNLASVKKVVSECLESGKWIDAGEIDLIKLLKLNPDEFNK